MHLICSPSPRYVGFSRTGYVPSISLFSRTRLCTQSTEGCWLTANSNCPEAIGSHFQTGSFIFPWKRKWSLALILNHPPAAVYKVIREAPWQTDSHTYMCVHTKDRAAEWSRGRGERRSRWWEAGNRGTCKVSRQEMEGNVSSLCESTPSSSEIGAEITAPSYGLCYRLWFSPFKEEVRNSCGCGGELRWKPWPKER